MSNNIALAYFDHEQDVLHATAELREQWRDLFDIEPPRFNRRFLESRLAYRIQELEYGGLRKETIERLQALGERLDGGDPKRRHMRVDDRPIAGTKLIREWRGSEHCVACPLFTSDAADEGLGVVM